MIPVQFVAVLVVPVVQLEVQVPAAEEVVAVEVVVEQCHSQLVLVGMLFQLFQLWFFGLLYVWK